MLRPVLQESPRTRHATRGPNSTKQQDIKVRFLLTLTVQRYTIKYTLSFFAPQFSLHEAFSPFL